MLVIFVDNALKYTPAGGKVLVSTCLDHKQAVVKIADTGKGIAEEDIPFVWERFYKGDKSHSRSDTGTGLGMAIAKEIIALHHGRVELNSKAGEGTTITVSFPALE